MGEMMKTAMPALPLGHVEVLVLLPQGVCVCVCVVKGAGGGGWRGSVACLSRTLRDMDKHAGAEHSFSVMFHL